MSVAGTVLLLLLAVLLLIFYRRRHHAQRQRYSAVPALTDAPVSPANPQPATARRNTAAHPSLPPSFGNNPLFAAIRSASSQGHANDLFGNAPVVANNTESTSSEDDPIDLRRRMQPTIRKPVVM